MRLEPFTREWLEDEGFGGFVTFGSLPTAAVPNAFGVYVILRETTVPPVFTQRSSGGWFKGRDPTVPISEVERRWVPGARVVNIGKAEKQTLRKRLDQYRKFGAGAPEGHWGGRYIWQLDDALELLVAWQFKTENAGLREAELLEEFERCYGRLPFANLRRGRRR